MSLKDMTEAELELWIESRFHSELQGLAKFSKEMAEHRELLISSSAEQKEVIELYGNVKAILKALGAVERMAVFFTKIGLWLVMLWAIWTFAIKEAIKQMQSGS